MAASSFTCEPAFRQENVRGIPIVAGLRYFTVFISKRSYLTAAAGHCYLEQSKFVSRTLPHRRTSRSSSGGFGGKSILRPSLLPNLQSVQCCLEHVLGGSVLPRPAFPLTDDIYALIARQPSSIFLSVPTACWQGNPRRSLMFFGFGEQNNTGVKSLGIRSFKPRPLPNPSCLF